jgi:hypothetical protein
MRVTRCTLAGLQKDRASRAPCMRARDALALASQEQIRANCVKTADVRSEFRVGPAWYHQNASIHVGAPSFTFTDKPNRAPAQACELNSRSALNKGDVMRTRRPIWGKRIFYEDFKSVRPGRACSKSCRVCFAKFLRSLVQKRRHASQPRRHLFDAKK